MGRKIASGKGDGGEDHFKLSSRAQTRDPVALIGRLSRWAPAQGRGDGGGIGL